MNAANPADAASGRLRLAAMTLALVWGLFWSAFGLLSGIGEGGNVLEILIHTAMPGLAFLAAAAIAWRWELAGGMLLALAGLATLALFRFASSPAGFLTLPLPGIVAGALFLAVWQARRSGS